MTKKVNVTKQEECHLVLEIQLNLNETVSPIEIFSLMTRLEELLELIVEQWNLYAHQNGRKFTTTKEELKAFLGINFVIPINKLPTIAEYWRVDNLIGNDVFTTQWFETVLVRSFKIFKIYILQITERTTKTDEAFKMKPVIDHLNLIFSEGRSSSPTDERPSLSWPFCTVYFDNFLIVHSYWQTIPKRHLWYWNSSSQQKPNVKNDRR